MSRTTISAIRDYENDYLTITSVDDLHFLLTAKVIFQRNRGIKLSLKELEGERAMMWQNKINRYYKSCGCNEGKFFVFLSLVAFLFVQNNLDWSWKTAGIGFLYCLAGAFVGKIVGKISAYVSFRRTVKKLTMQFNVIEIGKTK